MMHGSPRNTNCLKHVRMVSQQQTDEDVAVTFEKF